MNTIVDVINELRDILRKETVTHITLYHIRMTINSLNNSNLESALVGIKITMNFNSSEVVHDRLMNVRSHIEMLLDET